MITYKHLPAKIAATIEATQAKWTPDEFNPCLFYATNQVSGRMFGLEVDGGHLKLITINADSSIDDLVTLHLFDTDAQATPYLASRVINLYTDY